MTPERAEALRAPKAVWWVIEGHEILKMLRRVWIGEHPDFIYAEFYANSEHEDVEGNG